MLDRSMVLLLASAFAAVAGFCLLLPVVPLYVERAGGGSSGAGLATAVFMFSTVLTQAQMPRALRRLGYRTVFAGGLLALGLPAFLYVYTEELPPILLVTLARGVGFGVVTVVFSALVVELVPAGRRGEALGMIGIAITVPAIFGNSLGLWLADHYGYALVFALGAAAPLLGFLAALKIDYPAVHAGEDGKGSGLLSALGRGPLLRLFVLFGATTVASGVLFTFLPLAAPGPGLFSASAALLVFGVTGALGRWWAGRYGDRSDPHRLLAPGLVVSALGMAALAGKGPALLAGALLFGAGFGVLQNATLSLTMARVSKTEYGLASTVWNVAFDAGTGLGAFAFGFVIGVSGFSEAFLVCAALLVGALVLVFLDRAAGSGTGPAGAPRAER